MAAATLEHMVKLRFCQSRDSVRAIMLAERIGMIVACFLMVSITFGAEGSELFSASGIMVKPSVAVSPRITNA